MTARRAAGALFLCAAALLAACARGPELPRLAETDLVLAFGDSLTAGTGAAPAESYPVQLERLIGRRVVNAGVPGELTSQGVERLPDLLEAHKPKLVILCEGGNDLRRRVPEQVTLANLKRMVEQARAAGAAVVLVAVPQPALFGGNAPLYAQLARSSKLAIEDEALDRILKDNALKSDPIHPNAAGYRAFAQAVADTLRRHGAL